MLDQVWLDCGRLWKKLVMIGARKRKEKKRIGPQPCASTSSLNMLMLFYSIKNYQVGVPV